MVELLFFITFVCSCVLYIIFSYEKHVACFHCFHTHGFSLFLYLFSNLSDIRWGGNALLTKNQNPVVFSEQTCLSIWNMSFALLVSQLWATDTSAVMFETFEWVITGLFSVETFQHLDYSVVPTSSSSAQIKRGRCCAAWLITCSHKKNTLCQKRYET